jgi:hypothetical protein
MLGFACLDFTPGAAGDGPHGRRLRGLIVILWRAVLRIQEALALAYASPL